MNYTWALMLTQSYYQCIDGVWYQGQDIGCKICCTADRTDRTGWVNWKEGTEDSW